MQTHNLGILATSLMAVITLPVAFGIARLCLAGVLRLTRLNARDAGPAAPPRAGLK